jgi:hypothetical protein
MAVEVLQGVHATVDLHVHQPLVQKVHPKVEPMDCMIHIPVQTNVVNQIHVLVIVHLHVYLHHVQMVHLKVVPTDCMIHIPVQTIVEKRILDHVTVHLRVYLHHVQMVHLKQVLTVSTEHISVQTIVEKRILDHVTVHPHVHLDVLVIHLILIKEMDILLLLVQMHVDSQEVEDVTVLLQIVQT